MKIQAVSLLFLISFLFSSLEAMESKDIEKTVSFDVYNGSVVFVFKGTSEQVNLFELWSKKEGNPDDLEKALQATEENNFTINTPIQALMTTNNLTKNQNEKEEREFSDLSLGGFGLILSERKMVYCVNSYLTKKQELFRNRCERWGIEARVGASLVKSMNLFSAQ